MEPELPGVAVGLDHLGLTCQVVISTVLDVALAHERLEVRAEIDPIRRVDVDHLHLPAEALVLEQAVHHDQRVAEDHPVHPVALVLVRLELLVQRQLRVGKELELQLPVALVAGKRLQDRLGRKALVDEQRQRGHVEREPLRLARPVEERPRERFQPLDRVGETGYLDVAELARLGEGVRRVEPGCLVDLGDEPLAELSR